MRFFRFGKQASQLFDGGRIGRLCQQAEHTAGAIEGTQVISGVAQHGGAQLTLDETLRAKQRRIAKRQIQKYDRLRIDVNSTLVAVLLRVLPLHVGSDGSQAELFGLPEDV